MISSLSQKNNPLSHVDFLGLNFFQEIQCNSWRDNSQYVPGTQMEPPCFEWSLGLLLEGSNRLKPQNRGHSQVPGMYITFYTEKSKNLFLKASRSSTTSSEHRHALHHTFTIQVALLLPNQTCQLLRIHETNSRSTVKAIICRIVGPKSQVHKLFWKCVYKYICVFHKFMDESFQN